MLDTVIDSNKITCEEYGSLKICLQKRLLF